MNFEKIILMLRKVNIAILLAAAVEIPRWAVTFKAIHEPMMFSIPLAALITWGMSVAWERFFKRASNYATMFGLAIFTLALSTIVITPVIYLLTDSGQFEVNVTKFDIYNADPFRLIWSAALTLLTFLPLIILAADIESRDKNNKKEKLQEAVVEKEMDVSIVEQPVKLERKRRVSSEKPSINMVSENVSDFSENKDERRRLAWQMVQNGVRQSEVASQFGVTPKTIRNWIKEIDQ